MVDNKFRLIVLPAIFIAISLLFAAAVWVNSLHNDYVCKQYIDADCVKYCNFNGSAATKLNTDCNRLGNIK